MALYRAEVDRIHRGEGYYQAAAAELTPRGYPTRSVFNWRTPLPMWLLGKLPAAAIGKVLLGGLALLLVLMAMEALAREENTVTHTQTPRDCGRGGKARLGWQLNCHPNVPCATTGRGFHVGLAPGGRLAVDRPAAADGAR